MNYRHAFHAGNHADVFKHIVLTRLIALMSQKEAPFAYLDTHSGVGIYDLQGAEAERTGEWMTGISRLVGQTNPEGLISNYLEVIEKLNPQGALRYYPGSPMLAQQLMRPQDKIILNEMHPNDALLLKQNFKKDSRIRIHNKDGWLLPKALLPLSEKRAIILIDPPFEKKEDFMQCVTALTEIIKRMRQAIVVIWYPIKNRNDLTHFYKEMAKSHAPKLLRAEFLIQPADNNLGLNGSGTLIANPPWKLDRELATLLPYIQEAIAASGTYLIDWLIKENIST